MSSFVVLNAEGWVVTSAHVVEELLSAHRQAAAAADDAKPAGATDAVSVSKQSDLWAIPNFNTVGPRLTGGTVNRAADLAIGRLQPFEPASIRAYPVLRDAEREPIDQGESVCRVGFPFHNIGARFDMEHDRFDLAAGAFPVPRFALEGMVARFSRVPAGEGKTALFIETSTPGLRGQSGGPLVDAQGRVCGIQSRTAHLDLGFDARYHNAAGEPVVERQFLNVGVASHVDELRSLLDGAGVEYASG